jgi:hypothetical protein
VTRITGTLHEDKYSFLTVSRSVLLITRHVSDKIVEKIKTHILCFITFFWKSCCFWDNVEKYGRTGQAYSMLGNWDHRHTLRICNIHSFSTATLVMQTCLLLCTFRLVNYCIYPKTRQGSPPHPQGMWQWNMWGHLKFSYVGPKWDMRIQNGLCQPKSWCPCWIVMSA